MPATVTITKNHVQGDERETVGTIDLGAYATGGVAFTPATFGLASVYDVALPPSLLAGAAYVFGIDWPNQKIMAFAAGGTQVTNATDLSAMKIRFRARGLV